MEVINMHYIKARHFIYKNARPIDSARWKYLFENGSKEAVLEALSTYQNEDGGFAHGLEPDCWNPHSSPVQTWVATEIIKEIQLEDRNHPIILGILKYLSSGKDFNGHTWANTIASNNDYPHAPWWNYDPQQDRSYNPTACLIGFILKYADQESQIYELACQLAQEAYSYFQEHFPLDSIHTVSCFVELYQYMQDCQITNLLNMEELKTLLTQQIQHVITYETFKWAIEYVCKPSLFISSKTSDFYEHNQKICQFECEFILDTQEDDGTWAITWSWDDYPEQWAITKNWWKSDWILKYMKFLKEFHHSPINAI